jgi:acetyl-CoA C-acetyltransferase
LALELAGVSVDDIALVDLYSCFPSAVQLGARSLGLDVDDQTRPLTRTGGLSFAGGPWNDYSMHAIATIVGELRERPGELGLVWANGGFVTKHSFGVYGTTPPAAGFRHASPQAELDALPRRTVVDVVDVVDGVDGVEDVGGVDRVAEQATIEAYTVEFDRAGAPRRMLASCRTPDGRRRWASSTAPDVAAAAAQADEWVGRPVALDGPTLHPF